MQRITDVVKHLLIINIIMYFATLAIMGEPIYGTTLDNTNFGRFRLAMFYPSSLMFQPFQIVTHMFMHGSVSHLFFNMFGLFMFGPPLEQSLGERRFLLYYFITGFGALGLYLLVRYIELNYLGAPIASINTPMLGASGAIFGLLAGYGTLFPNHQIMLLIPPIPMKAKYMVILYGAFELFMGLGPFQTGIAHFAHLGGAIFGFLLIMYWKKGGSRI